MVKESPFGNTSAVQEGGLEKTMYAIINSGGKQFRVEEGETLRLEKLDAQPGDKIELDQVLFVKTADGVKVGAPLVENAKVTATILAEGKGRKVIIFKKKRRKQYRRKAGHRQLYTEVMVDSITV
jgi:large subunit ribosomal protein L21